MFCPECGDKMPDTAKFCTTCGASIRGGSAPSQGAANSWNAQTQWNPIQGQYLVQQLSQKVHNLAVLWTVIGCVQLIVGGLIWWSVDSTYWFVPLVGIINIITSSRDFKYSKEVLVNPTGIVQKFRPLVGMIIVLIYNVIVGGFIGAIASAYGFFVRSFVMNNAMQFDQIGAEFEQQTNRVY